tara:strand:- start:5123 stop:5494 length:372 start_codon:yes stop_codon:yes gene_type:complete
MDLFDLNNNFSSLNEFKNSDRRILIWTKKVRRSINTYMFGWNVDKSILKKYHSSLKKKLACNGSLKKNKIFGRIYDRSGEVDESTGKNVEDIVFHLQKDCVDELVKFLKEQGVEEESIEIKGI